MSRAVDLIRTCLQKRLCLVRAAAGWGKTTAVRQALEGQDGRWALLDASEHLAGDRKALGVLRDVVESCPQLRLVLVSRTEIDLPIATWVARGWASIPVTEAELALNAAEIREHFERCGVRSDDECVAAVLECTAGWPVAVTFAATSLERTADLKRVEAMTRDLCGAYLAEQVAAGLDPTRRASLPELCSSGAFDERAIDELLGSGIPVQHRIRSDALVRRALDELRSSAPAAVSGFLEKHGLALLQSGHAASVKSAIAALPAAERREHPAILMLRASLEYGAGNLARAKQFADRALVLADRSSALFSDVMRWRATLSLYGSREDAKAWIDRVSRSAPRETVRELRGPYAIYLSMNGEAEEAVAQIEQLVAEAEESDESQPLRRAYSWAMSVHAYAGDLETAASYAARALEIHERANDLRGVTIVRNTLSGAMLALADDREEALLQARAYDEAARTWGDPTNVKLAAALLYELAIERGDASEADRVEALIDDADCSFPAVFSFRLARAIRLSWSAEFTRARMLVASAEPHIVDPLERRWWHAAMAFFLALERRADDAAMHLVRVGPERAENAVTLRERRLGDVYAAFAELFVGRMAAARRRFPAPSRRDEAALVAAGTALSYLGARTTLESVESIVAQLEEAGQVGFARLLRAAIGTLARSQAEFGLTEAELRVLRDIASGMSSRQIARASGRSIETIRNQVKAAIRKMGVSGRLEAVAVARRAGIL